MKKYGILAIFTIYLLTGCSIDVDTDVSKTEEFANAAEELGDVFSNVKSELEPLQEKQDITVEDQKAIVQQINNTLKVINDFKEEEASLLGKMPKNLAVKELNKKEDVLLEIKEKAEQEKATADDMRRMIKALSDDYEINLFK